MPIKKQHRIGARCTILTKYVHPSHLVRESHVNSDKEALSKHRIEVVLVGVEEKLVNRKKQSCFTFRSDSYPNQILHAIKRYVTVMEEGPVECIFDEAPVEQQQQQQEEIGVALPSLSGDLADDMQRMTALGVVVDDDNQPAPENIPTGELSNDIYNGWGYSGFGYRKQHHNRDHPASLSTPKISWENMSRLDFFCSCFLGIGWLTRCSQQRMSS